MKSYTCKQCKATFERPASHEQHSALEYCSRACYLRAVSKTEDLEERALAIYARHKGGWTQVAIAKEFNITRQRVKAIIDACERTQAEAAA